MYQFGKLKNLSLPADNKLVRSGDFISVTNEMKLYTFLQEINTESDSKAVFVHGGPGYPTEKPIKAFQQVKNLHSVLYYHQRGCGKSTRPFNSFNTHNYYSNTKQLEKKLGIREHLIDIEEIRKLLAHDKITLIGQSFGAFLAALYAAEFPDNVSNLILISPAAMLYMPNKELSLYKLMKQHLDENERKEFSKYLSGYFDYKNIFARTENELVTIGKKIEPFWNKAYARCSKCEIEKGQLGDIGGWMHHAMFFSLGHKYDLRNALKTIKAKTLVLHGKNDIQPEKVALMYANQIEGSTCKTIENCGHFAYNENETDFIQLLNNFLA